MNAFKLDRRIIIFSLFALPVVFIALISLIVNSQPIYEGSKASEVSSSSAPVPTVTVTPRKTACLAPKLLPGTKTVQLYQAADSGFDKNEPVSVFSVEPSAARYQSLISPPLPDTKLPVGIVSTDNLEKGGFVKFVGIQGIVDTAPQVGSSFEQELRQAVRDCQVLVLTAH